MSPRCGDRGRGDTLTAREPFELVIRPDEVGCRLDRILVAREPGLSRSTWKRWLVEGRVLVDGTPVRANTRPRTGAVVHVHPPPAEPVELGAEVIALDVLFEDTHLIVIDKPAGLVVHPGPGHATGTLVNALAERLTELVGSDPVRPGIVHRLDKDTSGVMVVAKAHEAQQALRRQFQAHDIERQYHAIARGQVPTKLHLDTLHGRHPVDRKRFTSRLQRGRRAITEVQVLEPLHACALVRCRLQTGRTHQIRMQLAERDHPLLGDPVYGRAPRDPRLRAAALKLGRQALHASTLGFRHPLSGRYLEFASELPHDLRVALDALRR
ncbi:MAG: RluA family pseudouridine synthase [Proteobacteria bacterium]|nr:RluA family pseudouridine synthase [Pseudomonadota bacterium]